MKAPKMPSRLADDIERSIRQAGEIYLSVKVKAGYKPQDVAKALSDYGRADNFSEIVPFFDLVISGSDIANKFVDDFDISAVPLKGVESIDIPENYMAAGLKYH